MLFFGNEFYEGGNDKPFLLNNIKVVGISVDRDSFEESDNRYYGGRRGVSSTSYHLNGILELYEDMVDSIKKDPRRHTDTLSSAYSKNLMN